MLLFAYIYIYIFFFFAVLDFHYCGWAFLLLWGMGAAL